MEWPINIIKGKLFLLLFHIFLFLGGFLLIRWLNHTTPAIAVPKYRRTPDQLTKANGISPNTTTDYTPQTFPQNTNYPTTIINESSKQERCPEYFRWIEEDLKPWKDKGITREMVEAGKTAAFFRLVIVEGRVYVERYKKAFQTRDEFTIWGILQLLRFYPGNLPDLDLMFECDDKPVINKADYAANSSSDLHIIPMFHYCGDDHHFDIPFPDWSFWGWHEINIKPWEPLVKEIKEGNKRVKWVDRVPYAFWKGNLHMGRRRYLLRCNSTHRWNTEIYAQKWAIESRHGFRQSNIPDQCTHRYKIYMEGQAWSVSEKYIQACDSMLLLIQPRYYEFFTRSLVPLKHYWPINPSKLCQSIKFAVDWGNHHPLKAQEIGKAGNKFIVEELKMKYIYDYMFHLLNEYAKLLKYKPSVPPGAVEISSETMASNAFGKEKQWKIDSMVKSPSQTSPCSMPPPFDPHHLHQFLSFKQDISRDVETWEKFGNSEDVNFSRLSSQEFN